MSLSFDVKVLEPKQIIEKININDVILVRGSGGLFNWNISNSLEGDWYTIYLKSEGPFHAAFDIIDTDFDCYISLDSKKWIKEETLESQTPLIVKDEYYDVLLIFLEKLLKLSNIGTILILPHYQSSKTEVIQGPIPFPDFKNMLNNLEIPFNVVTLINNYQKGYGE